MLGISTLGLNTYRSLTSLVFPKQRDTKHSQFTLPRCPFWTVFFAKFYLNLLWVQQEQTYPRIHYRQFDCAQHNPAKRPRHSCTHTTRHWPQPLPPRSRGLHPRNPIWSLQMLLRCSPNTPTSPRSSAGRRAAKQQQTGISTSPARLRSPSVWHGNGEASARLTRQK